MRVGRGSRLAAARSWIALAGSLCSRPALWPTALRMAGRLRPKGSLLADPAREYLAMRMEIAYGNRFAVPLPADLIDWLEWCRRTERLAR
jgi:hypothetical protein